jgi:ATP-dependent DNA ligase
MEALGRTKPNLTATVAWQPFRNGKAVLWSRRANGFTGRFPKIARACENLPPDTMIDGEVIAIGPDGRVSFNALQHARPNAHLQFYVFDVLIHRGRRVTGLPLEIRRELLGDAMRTVEYPVIQSTAFDVTPATLIKAAKELELESVIASVRVPYTNPAGGAVHGSNTRSTVLRSS